MIRTLLLSACLFALAGCATPPNRVYWDSGGPDGVQRPIPDTARQRQKAGELFKNLTIIEFDEQGDLWNYGQLRLAGQRLRSSRKTPVLVAYVHGWMNSARPGNTDLATFSAFLEKVDREIPDSFEVQGVFIGWRGRSSEQWPGIPGLAHVSHFGSFWSRKAATNRIAGIPLSHTLYSLVGEARKKAGVGILIGHSFGGRTLERTLGPAFVAQSVSKEDIFPADLVILINPATEALYARQLRLALRNWKNDYPLIVSLTSQSDGATGWIWSRALDATAVKPGLLLDGGIDPENVRNSTFTDYRPYRLGRGSSGRDTRGYESQFDYVRSTSGHRPELVTHVLRRTQEPVTRNNVLARNLQAATLGSIWVDFGNRTEAYMLDDSRNWFYEDRERGSERGRTKPRHYYLDDGAKAYWIAQVPNDILPGHGGLAERGGIFSSEMQSLLAGLIKITKVGERRPAPRIEPSIPVAGAGLAYSTSEGARGDLETEARR